MMMVSCIHWNSPSRCTFTNMPGITANNKWTPGLLLAAKMSSLGRIVTEVFTISIMDTVVCIHVFIIHHALLTDTMLIRPIT